MPLKHRSQRDARLAPGFDQRPVEGGEQKQRAAPALEVFFDLGKVVEVILHDCLSVLSGRFAMAVLDLGHTVPLVNQAKPVEREHVVDGLDEPRIIER